MPTPTTFRGRRFDWQPRHDPRSREYPVTVALPDRADLPDSILWRHGPVLDQRAEGSCVGFGWTGELLAEPVPVDLPRAGLTEPWPADPDAFARLVYREAQKIDQWPGETYEGTSVLAGAKVVQRVGFIGSYRWAFGARQVCDAVRGLGPVVLGIPWLAGMYDPQGPWLRPHGQVVGGHCILAVGYDAHAPYAGAPQPMVALLNSWGRDWGVDGLAWVTVPDLAALLDQDGEACVPADRFGTTVANRPQPEVRPRRPLWGRLARWWPCRWGR